MNVEPATVIANEQVYEGGHVLWLHAPGIARGAKAGQFVMVRCAFDDGEPFFPRAFSYHRVDGDRFALLYAPVGRGTKWLARRLPGDVLTAYGPLGKGFRLPDAVGNLLLVGGGVGIAPLVDLAERAVARGHAVTAMMGAGTASQLLPAGAWPENVEYIVTTEDGSAGHKGFVTAHLGEAADWASKIYACGPTPMFQSLADVLRHNGRRIRPEILMEERMPCGWGMCYGCAIPTRHGVRLCCKDGPRFNLFDLF